MVMVMVMVKSEQKAFSLSPSGVLIGNGRSRFCRVPRKKSQTTCTTRGPPSECPSSDLSMPSPFRPSHSGASEAWMCGKRQRAAGASGRGGRGLGGCLGVLRRGGGGATVLGALCGVLRGALTVCFCGLLLLLCISHDPPPSLALRHALLWLLGLQQRHNTDDKCLGCRC